MSKVTSKRQVTVPKAIADRFGIEPGDELRWEIAGDAIRVLTASGDARRLGVAERLRMFDETTRRQRERQASCPREPVRNRDRGWRREDLYGRRGAR